MIRNRLAEIMFERNIKAVRMAKEIGISRNTIANTAANSSDMLQMKTIDKMCRFLKITPCEFFEYVPMDIDFKIYESTPIRFSKIEGSSLYTPIINLDLLIDINNDGKKIELDTELYLENYTGFSSVPFDTNEMEFRIFNINPKYLEDIDNIFSSLSTGFKKVIHQKLSDEIKQFIISNYKENNPSFNEFSEESNIAEVLSNTIVMINNDFFYNNFKN